jgi:hypothetical protein
MNVPAIPDYISPIVGYRMWNWDAGGLESLNGEPWLPGRPLAARCRAAEFLTLAGRVEVAHDAHEAPQTGCICGVYAAKNYRHLQKIAPIEYGVHGEVYLWGKVVEHHLGYRAQFAYPKSLVLPSNIDPRLEPSRLEPLMVYGADISIAAHILLWTKSSGYTPAGFDWLIERRKQWCKWCKQWHELQFNPSFQGRRTLRRRDCVTVLGRGIGLVERRRAIPMPSRLDDGSSGCTSDSVCIRLRNNDLYIVPHQGIVWNCPNGRWEVDLSGYMGTVILASSKGWKIFCRP